MPKAAGNTEKNKRSTEKIQPTLGANLMTTKKQVPTYLNGNAIYRTSHFSQTIIPGFRRVFFALLPPSGVREETAFREDICQIRSTKV